MARVLLFSLFVFFSIGLNAQNFHQKYDIDGFMEIADYTEPKPTFKKFKAHLESQGVRFDKLFRQEYEAELENYPDALHFYQRYNKAKSIRLLRAVAVPIYSLAAGVTFFILTWGSESAAISAAFTTAIVTTPLVFLRSKSETFKFLDSLLIYHTAYKKQNKSNNTE